VTGASCCSLASSCPAGRRWQTSDPSVRSCCWCFLRLQAYEEAELVRLKAETPGLTLTQYKEQIWKSWKKSPQNPLNQTAGR